jgi:hypothetical protein
MRERRNAPRYRFGLPGVLYRPGGGAGTNVVVDVISTTGCSIEGAVGASVGKKCELYIYWRGAQVGVEGQVVSEDADGKKGLRFLPMDKDIRERLNELCDALRIELTSVPLAGQSQAAASLPASAPEQSPARSPESPSQPARGRRRVPRYISELPALLLLPATGTTSSVTVISLSILGGCLEGPRLPAIGQKCEVSTLWKGRPLRIQGDVVWKVDGKRAGLKFVSLDEEAEKILRQICANLRLQPSAPLPRD